MHGRFLSDPEDAFDSSACGLSLRCAWLAVQLATKTESFSRILPFLKQFENHRKQTGSDDRKLGCITILRLIRR